MRQPRPQTLCAGKALGGEYPECCQRHSDAAKPVDLVRLQEILDTTPPPHNIRVDVENSRTEVTDANGKSYRFAGCTIGTAGKPLEGE